ncbi:patatin-like phospholipase family protein [Sinorhizobium fredii]|uniref:patatin-like phospholipase family protein n=1 Tax=Rhizobium fredii TaxID=380 RepID=UPI001F3E1057|nr:patatin-like phospholipase family protein [Sinorhizobium fredii]
MSKFTEVVFFMPPIPKIAIACQGGGSHAAFAAGVLRALLAPQFRDRYQLLALSGTSGGAMCAALVWSGLIREGADEAERRLMDFWRDLEVHDIFDAVANFWAVSWARLPVTAEISPYLYSPVAEPRLRELLSRHLDLASLPSEPHRRAKPKLLIGATDITHGLGVAFEGESLTYDELIASAAVPPLFRAVQAHGTLFWDGLFSRNPPVREFTELPERPDEIWVVQINPQQRRLEPRAMPEIIDRRNELSGNLALSQELLFITKINELLAEHPSLGARYKPIAIRVVELEGDLDYPSKLDRSGATIERLMRNGQERAAWFFDGRSLWPR